MNKFKENLKVEVGNMQDIPVHNNKINPVVIERIVDMLQKQNAKLLENENIPARERFEQAVVQVQLMKILNDYDDIIPVLDKFAIDKQRKQKIKNDEDFERYLEQSFEK